MATKPKTGTKKKPKTDPKKKPKTGTKKKPKTDPKKKPKTGTKKKPKTDPKKKPKTDPKKKPKTDPEKKRKPKPKPDPKPDTKPGPSPKKELALRFVNQTPLALVIGKLAASDKPAILSPLARTGRAAGVWPELVYAAQIGETWLVKEAVSGVLLRSFDVARDTSDACVIDESAIASRPSGDKATIGYVNNTGYTVDLYRVPDDASDRPTSVLEPGATADLSLAHGQAVIVRATVTQELVDAHVAAAAVPKKTIAIDDGFRAARRALLQPKPAGRREFGELKLVDRVKNSWPPNSPQYVHKSEHRLPLVRQFNTRLNVRPRQVRISGVELNLNATLIGQTLELQRLDVYADRVIVSTALHLPRTDVRIYARELVFRGAGRIDTTPRSFEKQQAASKYTVDGHPADRKGKPTYQAARGLDGEKAGNVELFIKALIQDAPAIRFRCCGSDSQLPESGGVPPYKRPEGASAEYPENDPKRKALTGGDVWALMKDAFYDFRPQSWNWPPGTADTPEHAAFNDDALGTKDILNTGHVVHMKLVGEDDGLVGATGYGFLPSRHYKNYPTTQPQKDSDWEMDNSQDEEKWRWRPGNGMDAYDSGAPGTGGWGGSVTWTHPGKPTDISLATLCALLPGVSTASPKVNGGPPGTPIPAYWLSVKIVHRGPDKVGPYYKVKNVTGTIGQPAGGKKAADGEPGKALDKEGSPLSWMSPARPLALDALVEYARDHFRNGHRDAARATLEPYHAALIQERRAGRALAPALLGLFNEIETMQLNMASNLDYHGHPIGWLPRLNVSTTFDLWKNERQFASQILNFTATIQSQWDRLKDRRKTLKETSQAVENETLTAAANLKTAHGEMLKARDTFQSIAEETKGIQDDIESLREGVEKLAKTRMDVQRVFSGFCKIAGGIMEAIPVGQPYLGLAGKTVGVIGDFDWNQEEPMKGVNEGLTDLGEVVDTFLSDNEELFVTNAGGKLRKQIDDSKAAIDDVETSVTSHREEMDRKWDLFRSEEIKRLGERISETEGLIRNLGTSDDDNQKREEHNATLKELKEQKEAAAKELLGDAVARLESEINVPSELQDEKAQAARKEFYDKVLELEKKKRDLTKNVEGYTTKIEEREKSTKKLLTSLKGVGSGLSSIGKGIEKLSAPYDESTLDRVTEEILQSGDFKETYTGLIDRLKKMKQRKAQAASSLASWTQQISTCAAQISKNLTEMVALSEQRLAVDDALDVEVQQYVKGMQKRAQDRLLWYQYNFAKAYEYEALTDTGPDFLNLDKWVAALIAAKKKIDKAAGKTDEDIDGTALTEVSEDDFAQIERTAVKDQLLSLAKNLVAQRVTFAREKSNGYTRPLPARHLTELKRTGKVSFTLPEIGILSYSAFRAKIVDLNIKAFDIEPNENDYTIDLELSHSGESIVRNDAGDKSYYYFQCDGAPISWGFTYNGLADEEDGETRVTPDKPVAVDDPLFEEAKVTYKEYAPSMFGTITLWIERGLHEADPDGLQKRLAKIAAISKIVLAVDVAQSRS